MPPTRGRSGRRGNATRGRPYAKLKEAPAKIPVPISHWPHLKKQDRQPVDAQPGCGFLTLQIHLLKSHVANKGWDTISHRASLFSPQHAAEEAARLVKQQQEEAEKKAEQEAQRQKEVLEQRRLQGQNVAFLTLKISSSAWEKSELPFVQSWKACQITDNKPTSDQGTSTRDIKPSNSRSETLLPLSSSTSNELEPEHRPVTRSISSLNTVEVQDPGLTDQYTSEASASSPATPSGPVSLKHFLPTAPELPTPPRNDSQRSESQFPRSEDPYTMSGKPSIDAGGVDESIKDVIQNLFVMQQHVASFRPEIQDGLNRKVEDLAVSLQKLDDLVARPSNPIHNIKIAPDIIDYVDDGRNPDIYTRDFVELVQRGNAVLNGKQRAFRNFSKIFAKSLKDNFEGMDEEVDSIMENAGMAEKDGKFVEKQQNGSIA